GIYQQLFQRDAAWQGFFAGCGKKAEVSCWPEQPALVPAFCFCRRWPTNRNAALLENIETKEALKVDTLEVLADKGYHAGSELKACREEQITTYVSPKENYNAKKDKGKDEYTCPAGKPLQTNGSWYQKNNGKHRRSYKIKRYVSPYPVCSQCPVKSSCLTKTMEKNRHGRAIERSEYEDYVVANAERVKANWEKYRRRQSIVEHPFGTMKRSWGYTYTLMKGKEKVGGEFGLIYTSYNFRRVVSILGVKEIIEQLKGRNLRFFVLKCAVGSNRRHKINSSCDTPQWAIAA
ncbi:MAG: transposase, partial [Chitinophagales bacterium]|nr:transposase [Chitinophagales bacterium]